MHAPHCSQLKPHLMWLLALSFFLYQFIPRLMPGLIMSEVLTRFHVTAADFGGMLSLYYVGYAGMQIPLALLLDRHPPRLILSLSALVTALGLLLFIHTTTWELALLGRLLVGAGSAAGFLGTSKVLSQWFAPQQYGWYVGLSFSIALLGAVFGGQPTVSLMQKFGWQDAFSGIACVGAALAGVIYLCLQSPAHDAAVTQDQNPLHLLREIVRRPALWILALSNLLMVGPLEGFSDIWGVPYLMQACHLDKSVTAGLISWVYIGMLFGGPLLSLLARALRSEPAAISIAGVVMAGAFIALLSAPQLFDALTMRGTLFVIGLCCCYQTLIFSLGKAITPAPLQGISIAFLNCMNMLGGAFYHAGIGLMMDLRPTQTIAYTLADYQFALAIIPAGCVLGLLGAGSILRFARSGR